MENEQISIIDLIIETHVGLDRKGPGSPEITIKALSFLDNPDKISRVADLGCGTGGQTMVLAQNITGNLDNEINFNRQKRSAHRPGSGYNEYYAHKFITRSML